MTWTQTILIVLVEIAVPLVAMWIFFRLQKFPPGIIEEVRRREEDGEFRRGIVSRTPIRRYSDEVELTCGHKAETGSGDRERTVYDCMRCGHRWMWQERRRRWMSRLRVGGK